MAKRTAYKNYAYTINDDGSCDVDELGHFESESSAKAAIDKDFKDRYMSGK